MPTDENLPPGVVPLAAESDLPPGVVPLEAAAGPQSAVPEEPGPLHQLVAHLAAGGAGALDTLRSVANQTGGTDPQTLGLALGQKITDWLGRPGSKEPLRPKVLKAFGGTEPTTAAGRMATDVVEGLPMAATGGGVLPAAVNVGANIAAAPIAELGRQLFPDNPTAQAVMNIALPYLGMKAALHVGAPVFKELDAAEQTARTKVDEHLPALVRETDSILADVAGKDPKLQAAAIRAAKKAIPAEPDVSALKPGVSPEAIANLTGTPIADRATMGGEQADLIDARRHLETTAQLPDLYTAARQKYGRQYDALEADFDKGFAPPEVRQALGASAQNILDNRDAFKDMSPKMAKMIGRALKFGGMDDPEKQPALTIRGNETPEQIEAFKNVMAGYREQAPRSTLEKAQANERLGQLTPIAEPGQPGRAFIGRPQAPTGDEDNVTFGQIRGLHRNLADFIGSKNGTDRYASNALADATTAALSTSPRNAELNMKYGQFRSRWDNAALKELYSARSPEDLDKLMTGRHIGDLMDVANPDQQAAIKRTFGEWVNGIARQNPDKALKTILDPARFRPSELDAIIGPGAGSKAQVMQLEANRQDWPKMASIPYVAEAYDKSFQAGRDAAYQAGLKKIQTAVVRHMNAIGNKDAAQHYQTAPAEQSREFVQQAMRDPQAWSDSQAAMARMTRLGEIQKEPLMQNFRARWVIPMFLLGLGMGHVSPFFALGTSVLGTQFGMNYLNRAFASSVETPGKFSATYKALTSGNNKAAAQHIATMAGRIAAYDALRGVPPLPAH